MEVSKKALVAWDRMCMPMSAGGLNLLNVGMWNKAALCKFLWNLCNKKDRLWVRWIHLYYIKGRAVNATLANQASWLVRKILKAATYIEDVGLNVSKEMRVEKFSIHHIYLKLMGTLA